MANKFRGQNYDGQRPSRGEELDQRFGLMVVKMRRGVEAFQANDAATAGKLEAELEAEIKALDEKVQREIAGYVRDLVLDELVPVATLHYAGPIGRAYQRLTKLALQAKNLGFTVDPRRYRDSIVAIPTEAEKLSKDFATKGLFDRAKRIKALGTQVREVAPKSWFEPKAVTTPVNVTAVVAETPVVEATALSEEENERIAAAQAAEIAPQKSGRNRKRGK